jgi:hypothetical protein
MTKLDKEALLTRRAFLKKAPLRCLVPALAVYLVGKATPPLFGASTKKKRPEPI